MESSDDPGAARPWVRPAATIRQVAQLANVSPATVSRVLSGSRPVREDRRQRVLDAVALLDYRPNRLARNLRRQQAETLGVLVPDIENPHFNQAVRIFEDTAFRAGYRLMLCNTDETLEKQRAYVQMLADERVRGVIAAPADSRGHGLEPLFELGIPTVGFDRMIADERADRVVCDNAAAARQATEHLIWLGHERIAFVGGRRELNTSSERLDGYMAAMRAAGLAPLVADDAEFHLEGAEREMRRLLTPETQPQAVVVANNLTAIGALRAIRREGLRIPDDIAFVGVDDPAWAELVDPPLTVVAQPVRRMAETAIELLLERIDGATGDPKRIVLPGELHVRESCGLRAASAQASSTTASP